MVELEHNSQGTQINTNLIPLNNSKYNIDCEGDAIIDILLPHSQ
jgi:hypothetical protein